MTKTTLALAAALFALATPALAETSSYEEYLANSGRWITSGQAGSAFASMRSARPARPMVWNAEKARFDRASEVH
jgi:hypothetical protein